MDTSRNTVHTSRMPKKNAIKPSGMTQTPLLQLPIKKRMTRVRCAYSNVLNYKGKWKVMLRGSDSEQIIGVASAKLVDKNNVEVEMKKARDTSSIIFRMKRNDQQDLYLTCKAMEKIKSFWLPNFEDYNTVIWSLKCEDPRQRVTQKAHLVWSRV